MQSGRTLRSEYLGLHAAVDANIMGQSTHPSSALCSERNVGNAAEATTLRQYAGPKEGNS